MEGGSSSPFLGGPMPSTRVVEQGSGAEGGEKGEAAFRVRGKFEMAVASGREEEGAVEVSLRGPEDPNLFLERMYQVPLEGERPTARAPAPDMTFAEAVQRDLVSVEGASGGEGLGTREVSPRGLSVRNTRARYD